MSNFCLILSYYDRLDKVRKYKNMSALKFICQPIAQVGLLGAHITHLELILLYPNHSNLNLYSTAIFISSENTEYKWEKLKIECFEQEGKNKFIFYLLSDVFSEKERLLKFDSVNFRQKVCNIKFKINLEFEEGNRLYHIDFLPIKCLKSDLFMHYSYDDINYSLYSPRENKHQHPLIVCLHGAGEGGNNNSHLLADRMATTFLIDNNSVLFESPYILAPQCPSFWLDKFEYKGNVYVGERDYTETLIDIIKLVIKNNSIDINRIYVIGSSMGGYQALRLISSSPELFAAGIISCPAKLLNNQELDRLYSIPLWFVHSELDQVVPITNTSHMVQYLDMYNKFIKRTYLSKVKINNKEIDPHCVFIRVYENEIYDNEISVLKWLSIQNKGGKYE